MAVVVTLAYLARQIRQQNLAQNLSVKESILEEFNRANEHLATNPDSAILMIRGYQIKKPEHLLRLFCITGK